jgi:hypothetical protein
MNISMTREDQLIIARCFGRGMTSINTLGPMLEGDRDDAIRFFSREEGKACDLAHAQEEFHAWAQAEDDAELDQLNEDLDNFNHMSYGSSD